MILLTNYYPYQKGEEYIENEIQYLARDFDRVLVLATMTKRDDKPTRKVPANVKYYSAGVSHSRSGKIKMVWNHLLKAEKNRKQHSHKVEYRNPVQKLYATYFEARFLEVYPRVTAILDEEKVRDYKDIKLYSYWLYMTARLAAELKKDYFAGREIFTFSRAHRYDVDEGAAPLGFLPFRPFLLEGLDKVFPVTKRQVQALTDKYPEARGKVELRTLGTVHRGFREPAAPDEVPILVSCSGIRKVKRIDLIVEALAELQKRSPEQSFQWFHFGDGPDASAIRKAAEEKLEPQHFQFMGHIPNSRLHDWYQKNRPAVFLNTSSSEGVPVSIMEACSYGIPIIATDVGGTSDIVIDEKNGCLLPADLTAGDLTDALERILDLDEGTYREMCLASFEEWNRSYNAEIVYDQFAREISGK